MDGRFLFRPGAPSQRRGWVTSIQGCGDLETMSLRTITRRQILAAATSAPVQFHNASGSMPEDTDPHAAGGIAGGPAQAAIGAVLWPQTAAESAASIIPHTYAYPEGDIRRYGATPASGENHAAINLALSVSSNGGAAAYIPPGRWTITAAVGTVPARASMYGAGNSSQILCSSCNGITFGTASSYSTISPPNCFFRDFMLIGSDSSTSTYTGIYSDLAAKSGFMAGIRFENIGIISFQIGVRCRGFNTAKFDQIFMYNVCQGFEFLGQSIAISIIASSLIRGTMIAAGGAGTAEGISFNTTAGESAQGIHISHCNVYNFDTNIDVTLGFEIQIEHCDLSVATNTGVSISTLNGGVWVRDCWIEMAGGVAGTVGVKLPGQAVDNFQKIHVHNNNIICDAPFAGSIGVQLLNNHFNVQILGNYIGGFDRGIAVTMSSPGIGGAQLKHNTIDILTSVYSASSFTVQANASSTDIEVGPNGIVQGIVGVDSPTNTWFSAAAMTDGSTSVGVAASSAFPVGTPVQVDATKNAFAAGVTYYVISHPDRTHITIGATPGGSKITATGNTAVNVFAAPLPFSTDTGATPAGLSLFAGGAFIMTLSDPAVSGVCHWQASGKIVTLTLPSALTGAATSTMMTATGLPKFLAPFRTSDAICAIENDTVAGYGMMRVTPAAGISVYTSPRAGEFTKSGTKSLLTTDITYSLA
jgi:hypothetical protein